ncbi:hypothetical protein P152DRAFT_510068 [Eremomyces bilateralis CBS 781.70]|uniref:Alpha/beta-hydrolase n=1 Tax=Eremomyces bilateralis CBS 781.70 TaxID=1392243 RepID=A0A6G1FQK8_9PEZI|nr:uncharacterized protein P152DRAFT_510068 [Eremomyces bilateralis CBS 781.70]KAF1808026.1 hypothetical protein P152DRAFT_510068 [Eremomyces bilateralis CBS 781.70]
MNRTDFQCANLNVPLDYSNKSDTRKASLAIIRIPAGGPGGDGIVNMAASASTVQPWDPRGTGQTLFFDCYANNTDSDLSLTTFFNLASESDQAFACSWAEGDVRGNTCKEIRSDWGDYVGTAFTIRDTFSILDNLGEGDKPNYWGVSYGTLLGNTAVNMFPDRMDRVILDGVLNPHEYYHTLEEPQQYADTDEEWREFLRGCMKHPDTCALAPLATSPEDLEQKLNEILSKLAKSPCTILNSLYYLTRYPSLAIIRAGVLTNDQASMITANYGSRTGHPNVNDGSIRRQSLFGISCGDKIVCTDDQHRDVRAVAIYGEGTVRAYEGDFTATTSQPVLIIGNTWDPVTPLVSAQNVSAGLEGNELLQHNGHGLLPCTSRYIAGYFVNGTLPKPGTKCERDNDLFVV